MACCEFHNENCVDLEEACCMACPTWTTPHGLERIGWAHQDAEGRWFFHAENADHLGCRPVWIKSCPNYTARKWSPLSPVPEDDTCVNCGQPRHPDRSDPWHTAPSRAPSEETT